MNKKKTFFYVIRWNIIESLTYQGLYCIHKTLLFGAVGGSFYGIISTVFWITYTAMLIANLGMESLLASYFPTIAASKKNALNTLLLQCALQCCVITACFLFCQSPFAPVPITTFCSTQQGLAVLIALAALLESIKKVIKIILQLAFYSAPATIIELATLMCYITMVWTWYFAHGAMTLYTILIPLVLTALGGLGAFSYFLYIWYAQLPDNDHTSLVPEIISVQAIKNRFFTFGNQIGQLLFSPKSLVPLCALYFDLQTTGVISYLATLFQSLNIILQKIWGRTSDVFMSQTADKSLEEKKHLFNTMTYHLHQVCYGIIIFFLINYKKIVYLLGFSHDAINWHAIVFIFFISFIENFFIIHERFYILQKKSFFLFTINTLLLVLLYATLLYQGDPFISLCIVVFLRCLLFLIIGAGSFYYWRVQPGWGINPKVLAFFLLCSAAFFFLVKI